MSNRTQRRAEQRRIAKLAQKAASPAVKPATSEAQIAANRENATHSTGPRTEAGRSAVSQNRTTHGLNYNPQTFRVLDCENQSDYDTLLQTLQTEQAPTDTTEALLVISMAQHRWLLDRATRLQETCFDQESGRVTDQKLFSLYLRYATTHERAFHKCLNDLLKLRSVRQKAQIGFESQKRQSERHTWLMRFQEMECTMLQMKVLEAERGERRAKNAEELEKTAQNAA